MLNSKKNLIYLLMILFLFTGCAATDINVSKVKLKIPKDEMIELPIEARAEIVVPLGSGDRKMLVGNGYGVWQLNEGKVINATAKEVFERIFSEIESRGDIHDPHFSIMIKSDASVDVVWGSYSADVKTNIVYGNGEKFGSYEAKGKHMSGLVNDHNALENAYRKAFLEIVDMMLNNKDTLALLKKGVNESQIRVTDKTKIKLQSEYQEFSNPVVTITVEQMNEDDKKKFSSGGYDEDPHGSGFFVRNDGTILTNQHVLEDAKTITVRLTSGDEYIAKVIAEDEWVDLALIKIDLSDNDYLDVENTKGAYKVGAEVIAVGSPLRVGKNHSVSKGIISSIKEIDGQRVIQTDTAINVGNSGGPLIELNSKEVIGIITLKVFGADNVAFALPIENIKSFVQESTQQ